MSLLGMGSPFPPLKYPLRKLMISPHPPFCPRHSPRLYMEMGEAADGQREAFLDIWSPRTQLSIFWENLS